MTISKTGLFSAVVAAFIIEFYKTLSPNSGDQTVALLEQISQQLANLPNGTYSNTANQPSPPSASMIWVNAMWLISFVFSLASALIATLLQEWARRYVEIPDAQITPHYLARVRSFLFLGTELYKMRTIVRIGFSLLHLSVYLFFGGLVILFHTINKKVAISVDIAVGISGLAYTALTIVPCLDVACPYRTPLSYILWYPLHATLSFAAVLVRWFVGLLHGFLVKPSLENAMTPRQRILIRWLESREKAIKTHWRYITDGLGKNIVNNAINTHGNGDRNIVTRMFNLLALGDERKLRKFVASIPRDRVFELIPLIDSGRIVFRDYLLILLRSCATTRVSQPDEDVCKRSLLVCLDSIHYIAKNPEVPDLEFVRANFANIGLMQDLWDDNDTAISFTSRSICALLAKQVVRGALEEPQLRWLRDITGEPPRTIYGANIVTRDHMVFKFFVYGVFSNQVGDLPTESFKDTLAILLDIRNDARFDTDYSRNWLSEKVEWIQRQDPHGSRGIVVKLRSMFSFLPPDSGDASPPRNIMSGPTSLYPPAQPSGFTTSFRFLPEHITSPDLVQTLPDFTAPFPEPRLTHPHASNVLLEEDVQSPQPPPAPPQVPYGVLFVDSRSHLAAPLSDATIPSPAPQLTDSAPSNVTPEL